MPSSFVGCQSIGAIRSLNLDDWPSFHLRKIVQRIARPPTEAATTMITVVTVLLVCVAAAEAGETELVAAAAATTEAVWVTVDLTWSESAAAAAVTVSWAAAVVCAAVVVGVVVVGTAELTETKATEADEALADALTEMLSEAEEVEADTEADATDTLADADVEICADVDADAADTGLEAEVLGSGTAFSTGTRADATSGKGERFLTRRLRLSWARRWAKSLASTEVTARVMRMETKSVRERFFGFSNMTDEFSRRRDRV